MVDMEAEGYRLLERVEQWTRDQEIKRCKVENIHKQIAELETKRHKLHEYVTMKLDERDYHGVADAAMDLRELEVKIQMLNKMVTT